MNHLEREEINKNTLKQASKILKFIGESYDLGLLDDPKASYRVCSLLALVCEGRVEGTVDSENEVVRWSLTKEYEEELRAQYHHTTEESENIVKGPW